MFEFYSGSLIYRLLFGKTRKEDLSDAELSILYDMNSNELHFLDRIMMLVSGQLEMKL